VNLNNTLILAFGMGDDDLESLPPRLADRLRTELRPGERLVWVGQPVLTHGVPWALLGSLCTHLAVLVACAGLAGIGLLLPLNNPAWAYPAWAWWAVTGVVALAVLVIAEAGLAQRLRNRRTIYSVTDRRALTVRVGWLGYSCHSYDHDALERLVWVRALLRPGGRGHIVFESRVRRGDSDDRHCVGLADVAAARRAVEQLLGREVVTEFVPVLNPARLPDPAAAVPLARLPRPHRLRALAALGPGERVLWAGRPAGRYGALRAAVISGCAVVGAAGVAGVLMAAGAIQEWVFPGAVGGPVQWIGGGLLGLALVAAPVAAWWQAERTAYVVTVRRALIVTAGVWGRVRSFGPGTLTRAVVHRYDRAGGDIVFEMLTSVTLDSDGRENRSSHPVGLLDLRSVAGAVVAVEVLLGRPLSADGDAEGAASPKTANDS
jgi:hypothetical protein